jgi:hypothetical protein
MSHGAPSVRSRVAAISSGLVVALTLVSVPAALAQEEGPDVTVQNLLTAIEAKDFEALPAFFCEEFASQADAFDLSALAGTLPEGTDAQSLLDAFILDTEVASLEVISQSDSEAVVKLVATMSMSIDSEALAPFIMSMLGATGLQGSPDPGASPDPAMLAMIAMMTDTITSELTAETTDIDEEITLVPGETMPWLICDELGGSADASPAASGDPAMADPMASPEASPAA